MRVGYLISQYPAPSHTFIRREVEALRRRGTQLDTLSLLPPDPADRLGAADVIEQSSTWYLRPAAFRRVVVAHLWGFFRSPLNYLSSLVVSIRHRMPGLRAFVWSLFYFGEMIILARELHRRQIGHVHSHFANAGGTVGMLAARYLGLPWSLSLHGISEFDYPNGVLLGRKLAQAQFAACVTMFGMAQAMRGADPADWHKLFLSRCGIDPRVLPPRTEPRTDGVPRILCVARLAAEKGHLGLLEAFAQAITNGLRAQLRLIGGGPERKRIEAAIERLGLEGHCVLLGQLPEDETLREMAAAEVLVCASFMEGLPVVLMEAMALGVPVVAPRVAGIPELVEEGVSGLLFDPADWQGLAARLVRLMGDSPLRAKLGAAGRARVLSDFDIDRSCEPLFRKFTPDANPQANLQDRK